EVGDVERVAVDRGDRAVADQHRGDPVAYGLTQGWRHHQLGVVVGVGVDEARHHPSPLGLDHPGVVPDGERDTAHRRHLTVADPDVGATAGGTGPVEVRPVADDHVVGVELAHYVSLTSDGGLN